MSMPNGDATHVSPPVHSSDEAHSWRAPMPPPHVAAHAMVTPPMPKPLQHTSPLEQSCALEHDWFTPGKPVSKRAMASDGPELDPELDPEPEPEPDPLEPPELEFNPPASSPGLLLVDPPHAAASAAVQLTMKRSLSILMEIPSCLETAPAARRANTLSPNAAVWRELGRLIRRYALEASGKVLRW
jgi:hypothetical protein